MMRGKRLRHCISVYRQRLRRSIKQSHRDGGSFRLIWEDWDDDDNLNYITVPNWPSGVHPPIKHVSARTDWNKY